MRKILINEEQERLIMEAEMSRENGASLPAFMLNGLESSDNLLKSTGYFLDGSLTKMAEVRRREIVSNFTDDIDSFDKSAVFSKLGKLISKCKRKEEPNKEALSKICSNVVAEVFGIPADTIKLNCEIVDEIPAGEQFHIKPDTDEEFEYEDVGAIEAEDSETKKRKIVNAICYGAAARFSEQSKKLWLNDVFEIDEDLPHLYSQIMKINDYLVFNSDVDIKDNDHKQGGAVEVKLAREGEAAEIHARGIVFPILLHETMRGVAEIIASYGLPDDMNEARRITNISDAIENDPWNMRIGPVMWDRLCSALDSIESEDFPYFFKGLVTVPAPEFEKIMKNVFAGTRFGKESVKKIFGKSKYDNEYDRFSNDLAVKREKNVIEDDYFTEEELEEGLYGYE